MLAGASLTSTRLLSPLTRGAHFSYYHILDLYYLEATPLISY